jgi:hypothetical protein
MADTFIIENLKPTNIFQDQCKFFNLFFSCNLFLDEIKANWFTTNVANYLQNRIGW